MPLLHIALQEGFTGEPVTISVNGREIYRNERVKTRGPLGLADSVEHTLPAGEAIVEIIAGPARARVPALLDQNLYIGVSLTPGKQITHRASREAFGHP
jgi:hypothetical protein